MNILFLTMSHIDITKRGLYNDLICKFRDNDHKIYIVTPLERRQNKTTTLEHEGDVVILRVRTLNVLKTNIIEKGLGQVSIEFLYKSAIKKYFSDVKFDLILYSTPPITFLNVIKYAKKKNPQANSYLLLKDIFPQNAIDLGILKTNGAKGLLYKYFRVKEKSLYKLSDYIGCMSPANVKYVLKHNIEVDPKKVEIAPNSFEPVEKITSVLPSQIEERTIAIRQKYGLPVGKPIFFYGGNLGKPQGIPFLIECLSANMNREDCHFVVVGDGTEYPKIKEWVDAEKPKSVSLFQQLTKIEYDKLAEACDVGLIFLDYRFTIPNYPSRLLNCLMLHKPIIAATDPNCDTGTIANENGYGMWCPSNNVECFVAAVDKMLKSDIKTMGENGYQFFLNNYTVQHTYAAIMKHFK